MEALGLTGHVIEDNDQGRAHDGFPWSNANVKTVVKMEDAAVRPLRDSEVNSYSYAFDDAVSAQVPDAMAQNYSIFTEAWPGAEPSLHKRQKRTVEESELHPIFISLLKEYNHHEWVRAPGITQVSSLAACIIVTSTPGVGCDFVSRVSESAPVLASAHIGADKRLQPRP